MTASLPPSSVSATAYDPRYDPLTSDGPGVGKAYAPSYWVDTAGVAPADDGVLRGEIDADVVIVGAGLTGLATAIYLASEHGIRATVVEANQVCWGCTSRNGGQVLHTAGRLSRSQWLQRWGKDVALAMHAEMDEAYAAFHDLVAKLDIQCDPQAQGHLYIAHRQRTFQELLKEADVLKKVFAYPVEMLSREQVHREHVADADAVGAMLEPHGVGIHPLKLAFGYLRAARALGVRVYSGSPVTAIEASNGVHRVHTPEGRIRARAIGFATGGYTSPGLHPGLRNRSFPVLSNSIVTRPLTAEEIDAAGFQTSRVMTDTRTLRYYYRKLPDQRIQIGTRGAITGADADNPKHYESLLAGFFRKFPALAGVDVDYSWWGWVDVSHDMMPRIYRSASHGNICYALGYGGSGVMYSTQAGRHLARLLAGQNLPALPIFDSPLPVSVLAPFRRLGQRGLYHWYRFRDERC